MAHPAGRPDSLSLRLIDDTGTSPSIRDEQSPVVDSSDRHDVGADYTGPGPVKEIPQIRIADFASDHAVEEGPGPSRPLLAIPYTEQSKSRTSTILKRLGSITSPLSPIRRMGTRRAKGDSYAVLEDSEGDIGDAPIGVDLSSLAGIELTKVTDAEQPTLNKLQGLDEEDRNEIYSTALHGLGSGMVIDSQLRLTTLPDTVRRSLTVAQRRAEDRETMKRARTLREKGQQEAEKRQAIVAVQELVDLSSFEDPDNPVARGRPRRPESRFMSSRQTTELTKSYYYPGDPNRPDWKPLPMRSAYIILLILISLGLGGVQEWLCQRSLYLTKHNQAILSFNKVSEVTLFDFFCWKYLPTLIFVTYGVFWQIMDFDIRRLEPFYQLSQPKGTTADRSLNLDYLTLWNFFVPFKALKFQHWAVFCSSVGSLLATSLSASLQNPSLMFAPNKNCDPDCPAGEKKYFVLIQPVWSRCLTASLCLTALFGTILLIQLRRRSGLLSDPKGIAGIAAMATKSHILNDFQGLDEADEQEIHKRLQHRRYLLYKSSIWQGEYITHTQTPGETQRKRNPHPVILRRQTGWAVLGLLIFYFVAIPIINFTPARTIPNTVPWLPVLAATLLKMLWSTLDFNVRMMEPFHILWRGYADPNETLTLDYRGTPYGYLPVKALLNGHLLVAVVGMGSILADILTVTVSSFSVNGAAFLRGPHKSAVSSTADETFKSFWGSVILSLLILAFLIFSAIFVYFKRGKPFLPRQPSTIASVLAFIFASNMLFSFIGTEQYSNNKMDSLLKEKGRRYGLGWFTGYDQKTHVAIDEMPWRGRYEYGKLNGWMQAPWEGSRGDRDEYV